ncbi:MAG: replicative DNA helicase [Bacteroidia bacterium]|nr:MAG: replicative DNA helicase [Bacteroidia bacterium]
MATEQTSPQATGQAPQGRRFTPQGTAGIIGSKLPPNAKELEAAVLGALMMDQELAIDMQEFLHPEHFYEPQHATIYAAISGLVLEKRAVDILSVSQKLRDQQKLEEVGGHTRLLELTMQVASGAHAVDHAKVVVEKYLMREVIHIANDIQHQAYNGETDVEDLMEEAESKIFELHESGMRKEIRPAETVVKETLDFIEELKNDIDKYSGVPTGFPLLDEVTLGWQPGDLIILAARPSMGKTAFALTMARNMAIDLKQSVAFFSLEMSNMQLMMRMLVSETGIDAKMLRSGRLSEQEMGRLVQAGGDISEAKLYLDDSMDIGIGEIRAKCRRLKSKHNVGFIVIDYLQLIQAPVLRNSNREQQVSMISRELKALAKELNVPIMALAQLSRDAEKRGKGAKPILSDLRESGSIEQDADLVLFIHRPEKSGIEKFPDETPTAGKAEIIIAKHRNGETTSIFMDFIGSQTKFVDNLDRVNHNDSSGGIASGGFAAPPSAPAQILGSRINESSPVEGGSDELPPIAPSADLPF